jgi:hypothetical protein
LIENNVLELGKTEENINDYLLFCEHFIPCVIGKISVRNSLAQGKNYSQYCTNSDETMALLVYANNFDTWLNMAMIKAGERTGSEKIKQRFFDAGKGKGNTYNKEGRAYYNKMNNMSFQHRNSEQGTEFDKLFNSHLLKSKSGENIIKKRKAWEERDPNEESKYNRIVMTKNLRKDDEYKYL